MCRNCLISVVATYFVVYFLITALTNPVLNVWLYSLIITVLVFIAVVSCPLNKEGLVCCTSKPKAVKKKK